MMMKIEFKKIKVANGLIWDIKGYYIHLISSSDSPNKKNYDIYMTGRNLCMVWRGRLKSKAAKYHIEDRVQESKMVSGLLRDISGYHIHFVRLPTHLFRKVMTFIRLSETYS